MCQVCSGGVMRPEVPRGLYGLLVDELQRWVCGQSHAHEEDEPAPLLQMLTAKGET
jgi:hypothetical protein